MWVPWFLSYETLASVQGLSGAPWLVCCEGEEVLVVDLGTSEDIFDSFHIGFCTSIPLAVIRRAGYVLEVPIFDKTFVFYCNELLAIVCQTHHR